MKTIIIFYGLVALTFGEIASSNKYDLHQSQHEDSVNAAKQILQERLSKLEAQSGYGQQYGNSYGSSGSQKYVVGCSTCYGGSENRVSYNSRQSSSSSSQQRSSQGLENSDYVGIGIVGHSNDARFSANNEDNEDVQNIVAPSYNGATASRYSSSSAHEAEDMQQRVVPADLSSISSSAYRASQQSQVSEIDENELQRTVGQAYKPVYSHSRSGSASETSRGASVAPVYSGSQTQSHRSSQSESELSESRKPVPTGQYVSMSARPGSSTVLAVPVRVIQTHGIPDEHQKYYTRASDYSSGSESSSNTRSHSQNPTSTTYRVVYNPTRNYVSSDKISSTSESESSRTNGGVQQPEKLTSYNSYAGEQQGESSFDQNQVHVSPVSVSYPANGGSSRFASSASNLNQNGQIQTRVPAFSVNTIESASSSRTAEERDQRRYTPSSPTYISSSRNAEHEENRNQGSSISRPNYAVSGRVSSGSDQQSSSQYGTSGSAYYVPNTNRQTQVQHQTGASQTQYQRQGGYNFSPSSSRISSDRLTQRFGSGITNYNTDDLQTYMSESERLARLQQQQIAGSSSSAVHSNSEANRRTIQTASNLDSTAANFVRGSNLANRNSEFDLGNTDASNGYNRVRSWNKQSKWSSGSEYGTDGKPKSYSTLSTAEAEKYNINGNEAGYKAATTTLENDGKVSTYSIHT